MDGYQILVINIAFIILCYSGVALWYKLVVFWYIFIEWTGKNFIQLTLVAEGKGKDKDVASKKIYSLQYRMKLMKSKIGFVK